MVGSIIFTAVLVATIVVFAIRVKQIRGNILLGRDIDLSGNIGERLAIMGRVALGQSKMVTRPLAGVMHIFIYAGFVIINIEILEIIIDGIFGTHRVFFNLMGPGLYVPFINAFEILALLVLLACVVFLARRASGTIKRFYGTEMGMKRLKGMKLTLWPRTDANIILIIEILLMLAFLTMNAADSVLMAMNDSDLAARGHEKYNGLNFGPGFDWFVISGWITGLLPNNVDALVFIERFCWWFHIVGILFFLNYIPFSKHLHIFLAFPNSYYTRLKKQAEFDNLAAVTKEVKLMMDPSADPYAAPAEPVTEGEHQSFGANDVQGLTWKQLLDAYSCTECGRCTSQCPANITGKLLSPRKIMMDTRDRAEEVGRQVRKTGKVEEGKTLLHDYITPEELWACTTCQACVQACPVNIDPLSIIVDLRRYLVMEQSAAPQELNLMFTNVENNGAPWQFAQSERGKWAEEM